MVPEVDSWTTGPSLVGGGKQLLTYCNGNLSSTLVDDEPTHSEVSRTMSSVVPPKTLGEPLLLLPPCREGSVSLVYNSLKTYELGHVRDPISFRDTSFQGPSHLPLCGVFL